MLVLVPAGILLCFVALLGFAGAWLSQYQVGQKMLTLYAVLMAILFLLVVIAGGVLVAAANNLVRGGCWWGLGPSSPRLNPAAHPHHVLVDDCTSLL
jgi:hypothetical protein